MARRKKGGISLTAPPFLAPALASANDGAGVSCHRCRAALEAGSARIRRIAFEPKRPSDPSHGTIASRIELECDRCGGDVAIELHFHRPTKLSALVVAVQCSALREIPADAP